jgi:hypothetical protein
MILDSKKEILKYAGGFDQLFGIKHYTLTNGRANGVRAMEVRNGAGLEFTVLPDRCMDIAGLTFKGVNCSYFSKTGIVAPQYYDKDGDDGFLRNFFGGFLTTCGLRNVGRPCQENGEPFGQHGRIANIAGEDVCATTDWIEDVAVMKISGKVKEAAFFREYLVLHREIICTYGQNRITIHNRVENLGFRREALMLLFHFNIGYPLLDAGARLVIPSAELSSVNEISATDRENYYLCQKPTPAWQELVFYHQLKADGDGNTCVAFVNDTLGIALALRFNKRQLFNFTQWKQMGEGEYVMGLEPCNCYVGGRTDTLNKEHAEYLEPGESRDFDITIEFFNGENEIKSIIQEIADL